MCDTKSSLLLCRVAESRRHLPFCRQYSTETGVVGNREVGSSRDNVTSSVRRTDLDASLLRDSQQQRGREPGSCGRVKLPEALLNVVMSNKRKLLTRLGQKGRVVKSGCYLLSRRRCSTTGGKARPSPHRNNDGTW
jgi:hypothetical protein